ncbi:hypothetical protein IWZ03DRAFT_379159 [Phyllosticta citriasiana]|uniref:Uncharacterized protein n=1 Tax=Phyllosticta citriasiana TaxID=595635 RepID=A0ABR1KL87_9PEZI
MAVAPPPYMTQLIGQAQLLATRSWEWGTLSEALLEWYNPQYSVFGDDPFPNGSIPRTDPNDVASLRYATRHIYLDSVTLAGGDGSSADPASLGVSAVLRGAVQPSYKAAAQRQYEHLTTAVPRWPNGAISHREDYAELWADFVSMVPPFLAYYAVAAGDAAALAEAGRQVQLYGEVLAVPGEDCICRDDGEDSGGITEEGESGGVTGESKSKSKSKSKRQQDANPLTSVPTAGLWRHIIGPVHADLGLWSTGNAWAAYGAARVLSTILHSPFFTTTTTSTSNSNANISTIDLAAQSAQLTSTIKRILDAAICLDAADPREPFLRNYLNDSSWFGDAAGTTLLAATAYRMVVIDSTMFPPEVYGAWADEKRGAVEAVVDSRTGVVGQVVNPLDWGDRRPAARSPEAQSFFIMMVAAWRDYVGSVGEGKGKGKGR